MGAEPPLEDVDSLYPVNLLLSSFISFSTLAGAPYIALTIVSIPKLLAVKVYFAKFNALPTYLTSSSLRSKKFQVSS